MRTADYQELKQALKTSLVGFTHPDYKRLIEKVDKECNPQQKAAITRMLTRKDEMDSEFSESWVHA